MKTIKARDELDMDLSDPMVTRELARRMPQFQESTLCLDFSGCILDYPATSSVVDAALERLSKCEAPRRLIICFNVVFSERMFLKWLFFGSECLGLQQKSPSDKEIRDSLVRELTQRDISLEIVLTGFDADRLETTYRYGK